MDTETTMEELHELECWELLRSKEFGRLAYHLLDEVHIAPINYAVDGNRLIFRTTEGSKLLGIVMHQDVAFEIDDFETDHAWSVIARGRARVLEGDEARAIGLERVHTWVAKDRFVLVAMEVTEVTGRRYALLDR
jgi:nitroimidazol reductase NimA-like FMN-containing flavoprotein (pyridoxamine 5'-phosphate oxidase superfamily)